MKNPFHGFFRRMLFRKIDRLVAELEERLGEDFKKLSRLEKEERAMRYYNGQKVMFQMHRFVLELLPWILAAWALWGK